MSWSVYAVGRPKAVAKQTKRDIERLALAEPEKSVSLKISDIIAAALAEFPDASVVSIKASGSQSVVAGENNGKFNTVSLEITPLWNFVE